jgi:hypothetical protein
LATKRRLEDANRKGDDDNDDEEDSSDYEEPRPKKVARKPHKEKAPQKRNPSQRKKKDKPFEPCDNCKKRGRPELCKENRPCTNCVINNIDTTCDSSHQNQPYHRYPQGDNESNTIVVDDGTSYPMMQMGTSSLLPPPPPLDPQAMAPYAYLQSDIGELYDSRTPLGGLPPIRPDSFEETVRALLAQDDLLRQSDSEYRPLVLTQNANTYWWRQVELLAGRAPRHIEPQAGIVREEVDLLLQRALLQQGNETLISPQALQRAGDWLRRQVQQPHTAAQDLSNFHEALVISQTNLYDPPGELFDTINRIQQRPNWTLDDQAGLDRLDALDLYSASDDDMEEIMTKNPNPVFSAHHNTLDGFDFDEFLNEVFEDPQDLMDADNAEPRAPSIVRPQQETIELTTEQIANALLKDTEFVYPITWYLEAVREGHNVELELRRNEKKSGHCTEDLNFWDPAAAEVQPCPAENGILCDAWACNKKASCGECRDKQISAMRATEIQLVQSNRAWFCKPCKDALDRERTRTDGPQPMLYSCYCIGQLQNNWLCNADRVQARKDIETRAREQTAAGVQDRRGHLCGHCRVNVANPTTGAWRCICCNQIVSLP